MTRSDPERGKCPDADVLDAYLQCVREGWSASDVSTHLTRCPRCRGLLDDFADGERMAELLREARSEVPPETRTRLIRSASTPGPRRARE